MRILFGIFVMGMIAIVLVVSALVQLLLTVLLYLAVPAVALLVLRLRRRRMAPSSTASPAVINRTSQAGIRPAHSVRRVGAPGPPASGWVMVPVWVGPIRPTVVDAEVIDDRD